MENKKMTKKDFYGEIIRLATENGRNDIVEFATHEIELLERKNSSAKESKTQIENKGIMETIYNELVRIGKPVTITELQKESEGLADYSNQKLSALLKKLVDDEKTVEKFIDKKKTFFKAI